MSRKRVLMFYLLLLSVMITFSLGAAQEAVKKKAEPTLEQRLAKTFFEWNRDDRPGGSILVVQDGKVLYQNAYGRASMEHKILNTTKTLYDIVTISQPFTAMAVTMLELEGELSLDDDIRKYIPELPTFEKPVTIGHLLYHTSGLWDWTTLMRVAGWQQGDIITFGHIKEFIGKQKKLLFEPGSKAQYSTSNYSLLAEIVTRISDKPFRLWMRQKIFMPLKMKHTLVRDRHYEPVDNQAFPYNYNRMAGYERTGDNISALGSHCVFTSVEDMKLWLYNLETGKVGGPELGKKLFTEGKLNDGKPCGYVRGWKVVNDKGGKRYAMQGQWGGWNTAMSYYPDSKLSIVVLCNWVSGWVNAPNTVSSLSSIFLPKPKPASKPAIAQKTDADKKKESSTKPEIKPGAKPEEKAVDLKSLEGDYRWDPGFIFKVALQDDGKLNYVGPRSSKMPLNWVSGMKFQLSKYPYFFTFQADEKGKINGLSIISPNRPEFTAPKITIVEPTEAQLNEYCGEFITKDLDVRYNIKIIKGKLVLLMPRGMEIPLKPEAKDHFLTSNRAFPMLIFNRKNKQVSSFELYEFPLLFEKN